MFKSVDKKLEEIGFYLVCEADTHVYYERHDDKSNLSYGAACS